jgi:murein endopeptidase
MRVLVVALALLFAITVTAEAGTPRPAKGRKAKRVAAETRSRPETRSGAKPVAKPAPVVDRRQSIGSPSSGRLLHATRLRLSDGVYIRRPERAFGTRTTVELIRRAVNDTLEELPRIHTLAIGDLSSRDGGWISEHRSHQSGRDVDVGLFYLHKPSGYPASFVTATEDNLDPAATFTLLSNLLATTDEDGGVQVIFLDYDVQGLIYNWAVEHGISKRRLARIFEYPHGRGGGGLVRHIPYHDNHMHVRFRCAATDRNCG